MSKWWLEVDDWIEKEMKWKNRASTILFNHNQMIHK